MTQNDTTLSCLYYPFSRLIDPDALKYLLLVFDSITFADEAEDSNWRKKLLSDMASRDGGPFSTYDQIADDYQLLEDENVIRIVDPKNLFASRSREVALSTLAEVQDHRYMKLASSPQRYGLPYRYLRLYD